MSDCTVDSRSFLLPRRLYEWPESVGIKVHRGCREELIRLKQITYHDSIFWELSEIIFIVNNIHSRLVFYLKASRFFLFKELMR